MITYQGDNHAYLGDGVYAEFDGIGVILRTAHHTDKECVDLIYLEGYVLKSLNEFYEWVKNK